MDAPLLGRWPVVVELPVLWGDMDAMGHVNNVVYLRWFESARIDYFAKSGLWARVKEEGVGPILARSTIDYRLPLTFPDTVRTACTVLSVGNSSMRFGHRVRSRAQGRAIAAEGEAVVVMVDYKTGRKVPISPELRRTIEELEATGPVAGIDPADA